MQAEQAKNFADVSTLQSNNLSPRQTNIRGAYPGGPRLMPSASDKRYVRACPTHSWPPTEPSFKSWVLQNELAGCVDVCDTYVQPFKNIARSAIFMNGCTYVSRMSTRMASSSCRTTYHHNYWCLMRRFNSGFRLASWGLLRNVSIRCVDKLQRAWRMVVLLCWKRLVEAFVISSPHITKYTLLIWPIKSEYAFNALCARNFPRVYKTKTGNRSIIAGEAQKTKTDVRYFTKWWLSQNTTSAYQISFEMSKFVIVPTQ